MRERETSLEAALGLLKNTERRMRSRASLRGTGELIRRQQGTGDEGLESTIRHQEGGPRFEWVKWEKWAKWMTGSSLGCPPASLVVLGGSQWSPMVLRGRGRSSVALGWSATDGSGLAVVEPSRGLAQEADLVDLVDWTAGWGL
ncbi:hypothetical protein G7Z17_g5414 [Cylindrodendrum hubeiense]|uniref:Uncharacterized protein n=1 Tax=Cylindrodendrum hubeiense TaxID=595255 RepID=A0A9P5HE77_9HYPO|nr:hypothetical protein G7Z17_g5414 [Cylindrodendrum hubeiense]